MKAPLPVLTLFLAALISYGETPKSAVPASPTKKPTSPVIARTLTSTPSDKEVEEINSYRKGAFARMEEKLSGIREEEKDLSIKGKELAAKRRELNAEVEKMGIESGLNSRKEALTSAQKALISEEKIMAERRASVQAIEAEINKTKSDFELSHGVAPRRAEINDQQHEIDQRMRHLEDRKRELMEAKRHLERHMDKEKVSAFMRDMEFHDAKK